MRVKRNKTFRRILRFYKLEFDVKDPYKVLVDGTFITQALQQKIQIREQLPKMLGARATPMVTGCVLSELRSLGGRGAGAMHIAKSYYRVKCGHASAISAADCVKEQVGVDNERKLLVATQDVELGRALRKIPGVPQIRLNQGVPFIEDPSSASKSYREDSQKRKLAPAVWEKPKLLALQQKEALAEAKAMAPKKKKGPKGANPLSCMKKKKKEAPSSGSQAQHLAAAAAEEAPAPAKKRRLRSRRMAGGAEAEAPSGAGAGGGVASGEVSEAAAAAASARPPRRRRGAEAEGAEPSAAAASEGDAPAEEAASGASGAGRRPRRRSQRPAAEAARVALRRP